VWIPRTGEAARMQLALSAPTYAAKRITDKSITGTVIGEHKPDDSVGVSIL